MRTAVPCPYCTNGYVIAPDESDATRCKTCGGESFKWQFVEEAVAA